MNTDDPKLTAFSLDELDDLEKSAMARAVAESPEAQRVVDETRELSRALKNEFAAELKHETPPSRNLIDIRDDPWFWAIGRPLAIAAVLAILAIVGGMIITTHSRHNVGTVASNDYTFVEGEQSSPVELPSEFLGPTQIPNPWRSEAISKVDHVVIGELPADKSENVELRVIETISDPYRLRRLKERLTASALSRKPQGGEAGLTYALMYLDREGQIIAGTKFYSVANVGLVLQPLRNAFERGGRYFVGGNAMLSADWKSDIDYRGYFIQFPDWNECIGYAPGA